MNIFQTHCQVQSCCLSRFQIFLLSLSPSHGRVPLVFPILNPSACTKPRTIPHRNVITALGHFSSWIMEILVFGVLEYVIVVTGGKVSLAHYVFLFLVPSINYVVFPIVQTLSSHDLR